ncbi:uncharacterized protein LOC143020186 [Oratosquilla oratoria]|uniref:uncharacterized protein LOC143020186 n=1 Tax=Oratosquilla oratoria TaxID=337810 RepID=UPI003F776AEB
MSSTMTLCHHLGYHAPSLRTCYVPAQKKHHLDALQCAWPAQDNLVGHLQDEDPEVRREVYPTSIVQTCQSGVTQHPIDTLIEHYSSLYRLKKAVGWWLRLIQFLKKIPQNSPLEIHELKHAENLIVKHVQGRAYFHETKNIEAGKTVLKSSSIYKLSPILIDGLLVVGGRLKHAALNGQAINPVILPHNHRLSTLIVRDCHNSSHVGVEWTLSRVRKKFWIIRGRKLVKRVKMDCIVCKRLYGAPMNQRMSDLPPERCEPGGPAFRYVGVDLFGPFHVKVGRSEMKRYGCLYTCFTTRAIHIEKLDSLQTDAFINGFVRFTARRGYPSKVWSDNGTNLVGARAELARSVRDLDRSLIVRETRRRDVEWSFNPPSASHHGGVWERMIRSVRKVLFALVIKCPRMIDDVLQTLFCEAESIVNSRPLTKCSDDASDESPLTPNHLLLLQGNSPLSWGAFHDADPYRKHWRHVQHLAKQFWKRWVSEYLVELQRRQKWNSESPNLSVGDLVLIMNENSPRGSWPLGRVQEVRLIASLAELFEVWRHRNTCGGCLGCGGYSSYVVYSSCDIYGGFGGCGVLMVVVIETFMLAMVAMLVVVVVIMTVVTGGCYAFCFDGCVGCGRFWWFWVIIVVMVCMFLC